MLEAKYIREHLEEVREKIALRGGTSISGDLPPSMANGEKPFRNGKD